MGFGFGLGFRQHLIGDRIGLDAPTPHLELERLGLSGAAFKQVRVGIRVGVGVGVRYRARV